MRRTLFKINVLICLVQDVVNSCACAFGSSYYSLFFFFFFLGFFFKLLVLCFSVYVCEIQIFYI